MAAADKLTRWLDLLSALLRRHHGAVFADLRRDVSIQFLAASHRTLGSLPRDACGIGSGLHQ